MFAEFDDLTVSINDTIRRWKFRTFWKLHPVEEVAKLACEKFGDPHIFNDACFDAVIQELLGEKMHRLDYSNARDVLLACTRIVMLEGCCHWLLIPDGHRRHVANSSVTAD